MAATTFSATAQAIEGLATRCTARGMTITIDEPPSLGGTDQGMNPVEALLAALASCKTIVARAFADEHGIELRSVRVDCEGVLDPDGFLGRNPDAKIGYSEIETIYHVEADNTPEEIAAFVEFVERNCPVDDTLTNTPRLSHRIA